MLIDELKEQLKHIEPAINTIKDYWRQAQLDQEFHQLEQLVHQENFWQNPDQAKISKKLQLLRGKKELYDSIIKDQKELLELLDLFAADESELQKIAHDLKKFEQTVTNFKIALLLDKPEDNNACFLSINAGAGGTESQDWANILLRMFLRFCEREGFKVSVIDYQAGEEAGIKSATLYIKGDNAYGLLKSEHGIHRLVRISPFDASKRRHTSFAGVTVTPEIPDIEVEINPQDLRIDTYRSGGAGGQHVNKTESAVRITHLPTGIVTQCQSERSQTQNKETAMKMLYAKIAQKLKDEQSAKLSAGVEKKKIEWGSQIRSYVLHPYKMVKDHRTDHESPQPDLILDGDLMDFIEAYLVWNSQNNAVV
jgi:peptide chain release factor 2